MTWCNDTTTVAPTLTLAAEALTLTLTLAAEALTLTLTHATDALRTPSADTTSRADGTNGTNDPDMRTVALLRAIDQALVTGSDNQLVALSRDLDAYLGAQLGASRLGAHLGSNVAGDLERRERLGRLERRAEQLRFVLRAMDL